MYKRALIENLETRRLLALSVTIDFKPVSAPTQSGMVADVGSVYANRNGYTYGWDKANFDAARDRNSSKSPSQAHDTINNIRDNNGSNRTWQIAVPNGQYRVRVVSGDAAYDMSPNVRAEGTTVVSGNTSSSKRFLDGTQTITVSDGRLTLTNGSSTSKSPLAFVQIISGSTSPTNPTPPPAATGNWPGTSAWKFGANSPINRFEAYGFSYGGKLYVMGGWADSQFNGTRRVDVFDPATNMWSRKRDMAAPQTHANMAVDAARGVVYFVGGHLNNLSNSKPTNEVWKYTIASDSWSKLSAKLPYNMGGGTAAVVGNKLYSFGGNYADRYTNTGDTFMLDLGNTGAGFKKVKSFPSARDHLSSVVIGGKIYAVGGEFGHDKEHDQQNLLHRYDPATDTWVKLANIPRSVSHAESSTFVLNGKIIIAGGQVDPQAPTRSVYQYDPATNRWTTLASIPSARQGVVVQKVGDYLVITTGGIQTNQPQKTTWVTKIA